MNVNDNSAATTGVYLITGFLGAGKTTFLKQFVKLFAQKRMRIIVNEFGREGIDGKVLSELNILIDEINNGSIFCSCKLHEFEAVLQTALADRPELIIIEASGLSDPTNIKKILSQTDKFPNVKLLSSICITDAMNLKKVISTARVCKKQLSISDLIIINKTDIVTPEQLNDTKQLITDLYPDIAVFTTQFGEMHKEWLDEVNSTNREDKPIFQTKDLGLQKALITLSDDIDLFKLTKLLELLCEDTYRIKGFVKAQDNVYLVDCVGAMVSVKEYTASTDNLTLNKIVTLGGASMSMKKSIENAKQWYGQYILNIE